MVLDPSEVSISDNLQFSEPKTVHEGEVENADVRICPLTAPMTLAISAKTIFIEAAGKIRGAVGNF